ncbi:unnamed protein product, partial [Didymodactylos carnosus]
MRKGAPDEFIKLVENQYMGAFTSLSYADKSSLLIKLKKGVKQGDSISSILFNLVLDELFEILGDRFGYNLEGVGKANAMAFADDLALVSGSRIGLQCLLDTTVDFLAARGGKKPKVATQPMFDVKGESISMLGYSDTVKYLGIQFTSLGAVDSKVTVDAIKASLKALKVSALKPHQKLYMLRFHL